MPMAGPKLSQVAPAIHFPGQLTPNQPHLGDQAQCERHSVKRRSQQDHPPKAMMLSLEAGKPPVSH